MQTELIVVKENTWNGLLQRINELREENLSLKQAETDRKNARKVAVRLKRAEKDALRFYPDMWSKEKEGRVAHEKLLKQGILTSDFSSTYFGYFKTKEMFGYFKLYGTNDVSGIPGKDYRVYADEIFKKDFAFLDGHAFLR
jgi:hypothetical protein